MITTIIHILFEQSSHYYIMIMIITLIYN